MLPIVREFYKQPRWKGILFRRTYPELEKELILRSQEIYPATGAVYQDNKKRWHWPAFGTVLQFGYAEHEKDVRHYDTTEYPYMGFDEGTSFTEFQYMYLAMSRCRSSDSNVPAIVRTGTNPGNVGHGFFRKRFVEPCISGYKILRERRTLGGRESELLRIFIPSKAEDNKYLMENDPQYISRLATLPEAERAAKLYGDWWTFAGQVFEDFRIQPFPDEPSYAQHVIPPFEIPSYWPRILAIDWGYSAMTIAGWYAVNPAPNDKYRAKIYKYREYACTKTKISTWAVDVARLSQGEQFCVVALDPSAWGNRGDEFTIAEQFAQHSGFRATRADNDRLGGKLLMQELLRWKPRPPKYRPNEGFDPDLAERILRLKGDRYYRDYCKLFDPEEIEQHLPQFQIFDTCEETIKAIPLCVYEKKSNSGLPAEDVAEFAGDDPYDETRYGLKACQHYLDAGKDEHQRANEVAEVCSRLEQTGNLTDFYIKMGNIDGRARRGARPMRRYHRRTCGR